MVSKYMLFHPDQSYEHRARIFKLLRSPRSDSKESIPPGNVACRRGGPVREPYSFSVPSPHRQFKTSSTGLNSEYKEEMRTKWNSDLISSYCAQTILRIIFNLFPCKLKDHSGQTEGRGLLKPSYTVINTMYSTYMDLATTTKKQKEKKESLKTKTIGSELWNQYRIRHLFANKKLPTGSGCGINHSGFTAS